MKKMTKLQYLIVTRIAPSFLHSPDELREIANEYKKLFYSDLKEDWFTIKNVNANILSGIKMAESEDKNDGSKT